jgi:hypothetical protein
MQSTSSFLSLLRRAPLALLAIGAMSCGLEKQSAPDLTGPSEFATSVTLTASPEVVNRDGVSQSVITATVRDTTGAPAAGRVLRLGLEPSTGGSLSAFEVTTNSNGTATFVYTAPSIDTPVDMVRVLAVPAESNFDNAASRNVAIALLGPASADPVFTFSPAAPLRFQPVVFNASTTMMEGQRCDSACTYTWDFGGEATATGMVVTYSFRQQQTYVVTLRATSPGGVTTQTQQTVVVAAATAPTAVFTFSPTAPRVGQTVFFNGSGSTAANGATIAEYTWDFGNGTTATGASPTATYTAAATYVARLTVRDSNGMTATITQNVAITP